MEDDEMKQHREKWKMWNEQRQKEQIKKKLEVEDGVSNYAVNLIQKISGQAHSHQKGRQAEQLSKQIGHEIQSNICSICLQLMIPPDRQPIILFPCGHNICKDCLFQRPPSGPIKKNQALKLQKCSLCRQKIQSYALNQSLMALICTYSNNKELLEKEEERMREAEIKENTNQNYENIRIRCELLDKQQQQLQREGEKCRRDIAVLQEVIDTLKQEKKKNEREMQKLQEQAKLINKCLNEKLEDKELLEKRLKDVQDKDKIVDRALAPLRKEKEKQELLQIARILQKK